MSTNPQKLVEEYLVRLRASIENVEDFEVVKAALADGTLLYCEDAAKRSDAVNTSRAKVHGITSPLCDLSSDGVELIQYQNGLFPAAGAYIMLLRFLLENVAKKWLRSSENEDMMQYFAIYFLDVPPPLLKDSFLVLSSTLKTQTHTVVNQTVATLLKQFVNLKHLYYVICQPNARVMDRNVLAPLCALPELVANCLRGKVDPPLDVNTYSKRLCLDALSAYEDNSKPLALSSAPLPIPLEVAGCIIGQLCILGRAQICAKTIIRRIISLLKVDPNNAKLDRLLSYISDLGLEPLLDSVFKELERVPYSERVAVLSVLLRSTVDESIQVRYLIGTKLLVNKVYGCGVAIAMISTLSTGAHDELVPLITRLLNLWSNNTTVRHMTADQHLFISALIVGALAQLAKSEKQKFGQQILVQMMVGVDVHLQSAIPLVRTIGMACAECMQRLLHEGQKLEFGFEPTPETKILAAIANGTYGLYETDYRDDDMTRGHQTDEGVNYTSDEDVDGRDESRKSRSSNGKEQDEDFVPYDMPEELEHGNARPPAYLRECVQALRAKDDPDRVMAALTVAERLVREHSLINISAVQEISVEMARTLLYMEDEYNMPRFSDCRKNAIVALTVASPREIAPFLTEEVFAENYHLSQRIDMLEILSAAARELSSPTSQTVKGTSKALITVLDEAPLKGLSSTSKASQASSVRFVKGIPELGTTSGVRTVEIYEVDDHDDDDEGAHSGQEERSNLLKANAVVQDRVSQKTRKFRSDAHSTNGRLLVSNSFVPVAPLFFFNLLRAFDSPKATAVLQEVDGFVLATLLHTCGMMIECAGNSPDCSVMATSLLDFLYAVRYHNGVAVRRAVLFALTCVIKSVTPAVFSQGLRSELGEMIEWVQDIMADDPDTQTRDLATACILVFQDMSNAALKDA